MAKNFLLRPFKRFDDADTHNDDGPSWRTRGKAPKADPKPDVPKNNYSGYYTKEEMMALYSPYLRPPTGFPFYDKVTSKTPLLPIALSTTQGPLEGDEVRRRY